MSGLEKPSKLQSKDLLDKIEQLASEVENALAVFDLDGTLLNYSVRTKAILEHLCLEAGENKARILEKIRSLPLEAIEYEIEDTLRRNELVETRLFDYFKRGWERLFFSDSFLHVDTPLPGAVKFVRELHQLGITIVYLTGRDIENMFLGTVASLYHLGFPVAVEGAELLMKPGAEIGNLDFKISSFDYLKRRGRVLAFFDDDVELLDLAGGQFPEALLVFVRGGHLSARAPAKGGVLTLNSFVEVVPGDLKLR